MYILLGLLGLVMGSFAGAQFWRLRVHQLVEDKTQGEKYDRTELKRLMPLANASASTDRSRCLLCGNVLNWYDLIPLGSWCSTRGKCRYCRKKIGWFEPVIELTTAGIFVLSYLVLAPNVSVPTEMVKFILWLVACVLMLILLFYDAKWFLLPNIINFSLIVVGTMYALLSLVQQSFSLAAVLSLVIAIIILSGLYWLLYTVSKGRWIGFGDVKLCVGLALLLGAWPNAFLALFLANLLGTLVVLPFLFSKKIQRKALIPFGPFLIVATMITIFWGSDVIEWYNTLLIGSSL